MNIPQIKILTEKFRAIEKAEIVINGITIVAGENGSGKSTISKLLYHLYKTSSNYEVLITRELRSKLRNIERFLDIILSDIHSISRERNTREEFKEFVDLRHGMQNVSEKEMGKWLEFIRKIENNFLSQPSLFNENTPRNVRLTNRLKFIVKDILSEFDIKDESNFIPFQKISEVIRRLFENALEKIKSRPSTLFVEDLQNLYSEGTLPKVFEVSEFEEQIISLTKESLSIPYLVQNVIYIDTPMAIGVDSYNSDHWEDLNELIHKKGKSSSSNLSNKIKNDILRGDVALTENDLAPDNFSFKRSDGSVFDLLECATGVKAFGIIQLLLNNGSINDKTLLIIDEPESHLHPQWIIEYARMIVLLNKEIGVKFFLASHNPDMVSALKHIATKEETLENVNFYLAQKTDKEFTYSYKDLKDNIEPIFESFNIALDRINLYAG